MKNILASFLLFTFLIISCDVNNGRSIQEEPGSIEAVDQWKSNDFDYYTFLVNRTCLCRLPYEYTVEVFHGRVINVYFDKEDHLNYESRDMLISSTRTIDQLFELLERYKETADHYEVEFHNKLGYPTNININPSTEIADEEIKLVISNLTSRS
ncbi:MAG: DUF6174 domain-containing protein [Balneolaceae bacterium]